MIDQARINSTFLRLRETEGGIDTCSCPQCSLLNAVPPGAVLVAFDPADAEYTAESLGSLVLDVLRRERS